MLKANLFKLTATCLFILILSLNYTGFCYRELRYLSDEEFLIAAISYEASKGNMIIINTSEKSARSFLKVYPNCCSLERHNHWILASPIERFFGFYFLVVDIRYALNEGALAQAPNDGRYYNAHIGIHACGNILKSIGIRQDGRYTRKSFLERN